MSPLDITVTAQDVRVFLALDRDDKIRFVLSFIRDNPALWDQRRWVNVDARGCVPLSDGEAPLWVTRCFGGWVYFFGTGDGSRVSSTGSARAKFNYVCELLGLNDTQATTLVYDSICVVDEPDPYAAFLVYIQEVTGVRTYELAGVGA